MSIHDIELTGWIRGNRKLIQYRKSKFRITWNDMELKSRLMPCRTMDLNPGLWSAEVLTNTSLGFQRITRNPFTTKKWLLVRGNPLRRNSRNNSYHHHLHLRRLFCRLINVNGMTFLPLDTLTKNPSKSAKKMTRILRHQGHNRESDGAIEWRRLLFMLCRDHLNAPKWTNQMWRDYLQRGSDKKKIQYCLDSNGFILYMRAIQGHSGGNKRWSFTNSKITWKFRTIGLSTSISLVRLTIFIRLSNQDWLQEEKIRKKEDKRCSSQPWIQWVNLNEWTLWRDKTTTGTLQNQMESVPERSILESAQDKGLAFWQTRLGAVILHDSVPADCLEKLVNTKTDLRELNRQIHSHRKTPPSESVFETSRRAQAWLQAELQDRHRPLQETRIGTLQEMVQLKKICCTEAERSQQWRTADLIPRQEEGSQSTVNQLTVQIQDLQK